MGDVVNGTEGVGTDRESFAIPYCQMEEIASVHRNSEVLRVDRGISGRFY